MTPAALLFCLALIWSAAAMLASALLAAPFLGVASRIAEPSVRARRLVLLRSLPTIFSLLVTGLGLLPAFLWLEPRQTTERVTGAMAALAALAAALIFAGPAKGLLSLRATRRLVRGWERGAQAVRIPGTDLPAFAVEESFPVAVVVGFRRPCLFIARSILESCDEAELAAVAAHEVGHLRRSDHWKRLLMRAAPDVLSLVPFGGEVERRWEEAAEQLADEHASTSGSKRALHLASALVKVARLVTRSHPRDLPLTALYRGEGVAGRVERLLSLPPLSGENAPPPSWRPVASSALALAGLAVYGFAVFELGLIQQAHLLAEALVRLLQ